MPPRLKWDGYLQKKGDFIVPLQPDLQIAKLYLQVAHSRGTQIAVKYMKDPTLPAGK